jgi:hypothetical protein
MMTTALAVGAGPVHASPPSVDNVVNVIGANVTAGKWGLAEKNIEALGKTISDELKVKKTAVAIASNPVQARLDAVNQRLQLIKSDYKAILDARTRIDRASARQARILVGQIGIELAQKLNLINARNVIDAIDAFDGDGAAEIAGSVQRLQRQDKAVRYLTSLLDDLRPAIRESQNDRTHLTALNRQFNAVLAKYGLTTGGAAVEPTSSHPRIAGAWDERGGPNSCSAGVITFTQAGNGTVTAITDDLSACGGAWSARNIRWLSRYVLDYDYTVTTRPPGWVDGHHRITFNPDGRTATLVWNDQNGNSDTNTLVKR